MMFSNTEKLIECVLTLKANDKVIPTDLHRELLDRGILVKEL